MTNLVTLSQENQPLDPADPKYDGMLSNLQGNILQSHGRHFAMHLFFQFGPDLAAAKSAVTKLRSNGFILSAKEQAAQTDRVKANPASQEVFGTILFSAAGLTRLGLAIPAGFGDSLNPPGPTVSFTFDQPMSAAAGELGDTPANWDQGYRESIDGLLIVAYGNTPQDNTQPVLDTLFAFAKDAREILETGAVVLAVETGHAHVLAGQPREHFGFVDGISQPIFLATDPASTAPHAVFDQSSGLIDLVVTDPFTSAPDAFASFMVFRKLEQNVKGWRQAVVQAAGDLKLSPDLVGAMAVGRFQNGDPVVAAAQASGPEPQPVPPNDFDYAGDVAGLKCPYHGHIRKANPRGDTQRNFGAPGERNRRIARRGITYGDRAPGLIDAPETGVGLLFMCYQANIPDRFGFMQKNWVNNNDFARFSPAAGQDAVIGQGVRNTDQVWPTQWGGAGTEARNDFGAFVTNKGGEFLLAVSIPTIEGLQA